MPIELIKNNIYLYIKSLDFAFNNSNRPLARVSEPKTKDLNSYITFYDLETNNSELNKLITNGPDNFKKFAITALVVQRESAKWLQIEKQENEFHTGSKYLIKLLKNIPQMSTEELKQKFPESFNSNRSDDDTKKILVYNALSHLKEWEQMSKIAAYTKDVEHGLITHSNILTNIKKEGYGLASFIFPELNEHIEYLDKCAEAVNSRKGTASRIIGNLTKDYFLDALSLLKGLTKGVTKKIISKALVARGYINDIQSIRASYYKLKSEGKSYQQTIAAAVENTSKILGTKVLKYYSEKKYQAKY